MRRMLPLLASVVLAASVAGAVTNEERKEEVRKTEAAFAKTMADRDHAAFASFLASETVFFGRGVLRGKTAVADTWKRFYEEKAAPFSWAPEKRGGARLGRARLHERACLRPRGQARRHVQLRRRKEKDGHWRIVFDKGWPPASAR